jgi:sortase A
MSKFFSVISLAAVFLVLPLFLSEEVHIELPVAEAAEPASFPASSAAFPVGINIPSIKLSSAIVQMGLLKNGELDVPSGKTHHIGWYKDGTMPGEIGSAVMDAHVYAAFKNLKNVRVGDVVTITMSNDTKLNFKITEKKTLPLSKVSKDELFNRDRGRELHLITCAGIFSKKLNTYTHRLLVYAKLVE